MAYFANGTEGEVFNNECADCIIGDDEPCPILGVHLSYNYEQCKKGNELARTILNDLVEQTKDFKYVGCKMKVLLDKHRRQQTETEKHQMELFN